MRFRRRPIGFVEVGGCAFERTFGGSSLALEPWHRSVGCEHHIRIFAGFQTSFYIRLLFGVGRTDCIGGGFGGFEGVGHRERDVLSVVTDHVIFEWWPPLFADAIETWRLSRAKDLSNIPAMKNGAYARHLLSGSSIQPQQFAV